ncbi:MAG: hypothetical protein KAT28_03735 [Candidatus Aenigmarchaeota archaeon]|nr:hypothetical protein [Candidatus Aenigmarchaeota archaeon]
MEADKCGYEPHELFENVLEKELKNLKNLDLDMPKIGDKCEESVKNYLVHLTLEDGKPEDYLGGMRPRISYKVPSQEVSILLGSVEGHYHIKTQKPPEVPITREDTLKDVRAKIMDKPNTYKTEDIGINIDWIADTKDLSIVYRKD